MVKMKKLSFGLIFLSLISLGKCGEHCFVGLSSKYCRYGCCGDVPVQTCCNMSTLTIVGIVIGAVLFLASLVCFGACIYFLCKNRFGKTSKAVQPAQNSNSIYVSNNAPYGHPPPQGHSNQYGAFPPQSSTFNDPAYPPGTVHSNKYPSAFNL